MKLSKYIKALQDIQDKHGDIGLLYTARDSEGNGYTRSTYPPEVRYISPSEDNLYSPDNLIQERTKKETLEEWLENGYLDEEDIPKLKKVILL
jgi:hypothetical protein